MEASRIASICENSKPRSILSSWRNLEMSATTQFLNDAGIMVPTTFPFSSPIWLVQKTDGSWRITVDYCKFNQVVTNCSCSSQCSFIAGANTTDLLQLSWGMLGRATNIPSLRVISTTIAGTLIISLLRRTSYWSITLMMLCCLDLGVKN